MIGSIAPVKEYVPLSVIGPEYSSGCFEDSEAKAIPKGARINIITPQSSKLSIFFFVLFIFIVICTLLFA